MKIDELEVWYLNQRLPDSKKLNGIATISDVPKFVKSHFDFLKANSGKTSFIPYWERLLELKRILQAKPQ